MKRWPGDVNAMVRKKRLGKVLLIKAVCKCIGVSEINARVSCSEAQCEGAYDKDSAQAP